MIAEYQCLVIQFRMPLICSDDADADVDDDQASIEIQLIICDKAL